MVQTYNYKKIPGFNFFELVLILFATVPDYCNGCKTGGDKKVTGVEKICASKNNYINNLLCFGLFSRSQSKVLVSARPISANSFTHLPWAGTIYLKCDGMQQVLVLCRLLKWERDYDFQFYAERTCTCAVEIISHF